MRANRVLVIDDSLTIRAMVEEILSHDGSGHSIAMAADVPAARELLKTFNPTLITLDLNMPGIGGLSFLDELRRYPHIPIVVLSSTTKADSEATERALERGADACFDKSRLIADSKAFLRVLEDVTTGKIRRAARN